MVLGASPHDATDGAERSLGGGQGMAMIIELLN